MPARPAASFEELYPALGAFPSNVVAEIVGGELVDSPRPRVVQTLAASVLLARLSGPVRRRRGKPGSWLLLFAPELHLNGEIIVPDLAGWRRERLPELPDVTVMTLAPDWVCEVLSPETLALDRGIKMLAYARAGVKHVWLVDPDLRTLEVYRYEDGGWSLLGVHEGSQRVRAEPFGSITLELASLWQR
ncbi:Uma2 family endonuclease [Hyalangium versicolor]|uniref:Uma2 family endonuclease n=1 Tax=Hyalangium versicolor TaxID=2861190 RepID=UPI001CCF4C0D|nr:Uma2 family endonuclease [Hyalangium versicolor]